MNTYMITGGTGGLGLATARLLAQQANTQVVLAVRDTDNAQRLTQGWNENVHIRYLNLADLNEVDRFIAEWDLPLADAIELGKRSIYHATHRDGASGGVVRVYHVHKGGSESSHSKLTG